MACPFTGIGAGHGGGRSLLGFDLFNLYFDFKCVPFSLEYVDVYLYSYLVPTI